jgi:electron transfer flavoprotein alpha/beta subunit
VITSAKKLDIEGEEVVAECDLEKGTYTFKTKMPAVITTALEINEPRIPSLMAVLGASRKKAKTLTLEEIGMAESKSLVGVSSISMPEVKRKKVIFEGSEAEKLEEATSKLIEALRREGVME